MIKNKLFILGLIIFVQTSFAGPLISFYPNVQLHYKSEKYHDYYDLYLGPIDYREVTGEEDRSGYVSTGTENIKGNIRRVIYDHSVNDSAVEIYKNMKDALLKDDFKILYECAGSECGDVNGWKLYLNSEIGGNESSQYYLTAKHTAKNGGDWYLAFYVNDLENRPRSLIDTVDTSKISFDKYSVNKDLLAKNLISQGRAILPGVHFDFDSAVLTPDTKSSLIELGKMLNENAKTKIAIVGHTDNIGPTKYNMQLSADRALNVLNYLVKNVNISSKRLESYGVGPLSPIKNNNTEQGRAENRRVEIVLN